MTYAVLMRLRLRRELCIMTYASAYEVCIMTYEVLMRWRLRIAEQLDDGASHRRRHQVSYSPLLRLY